MIFVIHYILWPSAVNKRFLLKIRHALAASHRIESIVTIVHYLDTNIYFCCLFVWFSATSDGLVVVDCSEDASRFYSMLTETDVCV